MEPEITYRGKQVTVDDIAFINKLISEHPEDSRRALSQRLCLAWNWIQPNGVLRDMVCRGLMLKLHRTGHIRLPAKRNNPPNPFLDRRTPEEVEVDKRPIDAPLQQLKPLTFCQVRRSASEKLYNGLVQQYHYLGYDHPVGEQLKYIVYSGISPVACLAWSSAPRHIGCRDRHIGWNQKARKERIHLLAYNTRFLILPWVRVKHLASYLLGRMSKIVPQDWLRIYHHPIYYLETFVDKERFAGTCYKAANWMYLGDTTGRGKDDQTHKVNRSIKAVYGYALDKAFRRILCEGVQ